MATLHKHPACHTPVVQRASEHACSPLPTPGLDIVAKGDPLAPQGFNPVQRSIIHPGDPLTVTCVFDSSNVDHAVSAGPTHDHEMCNMYLMVGPREGRGFGGASVVVRSR